MEEEINKAILNNYIPVVIPLKDNFQMFPFHFPIYTCNNKYIITIVSKNERFVFLQKYNDGKDHDGWFEYENGKFVAVKK